MVALSFDLGLLAEPGPWSFPSFAALRDFPFAKHIHSWASLSFRVSPKTTPASRAVFASSSDRRCPSHGVCRPFSGRQLGGSGSPGGSTRRHLAPSGFSPPRRLAPLRAFQSSLTRPLLGFAPSGLRSSRRSGALIEQTRALLIVALPDRAHASSVLARTRSSARWIRPHEGPGEPSSGLCSLRESVPLRRRFRAHRGRCPPGFHPPRGLPHRESAEGPSPLVRSRASPRSAPLAGSRPELHPSVLPDSMVALSLSRLPAPSRFSAPGPSGLSRARVAREGPPQQIGRAHV